MCPDTEVPKICWVNSPAVSCQDRTGTGNAANSWQHFLSQLKEREKPPNSQRMKFKLPERAARMNAFTENSSTFRKKSELLFSLFETEDILSSSIQRK